MGLMNLLGRETTVFNSEQLFFFLKVTFSFNYSIGIEALKKAQCTLVNYLQNSIFTIFVLKVNLAKTEISQTSSVYHYVQRMFNTVKLLSKCNVYRSG